MSHTALMKTFKKTPMGYDTSGTKDAEKAGNCFTPLRNSLKSKWEMKQRLMKNWAVTVEVIMERCGGVVRGFMLK